MAGYEETFARYYDALTADVDYRGHGAYLKSLAEQYGGRFRLVLDLACGTGSLAVELARLGAEVIGVDGSQEMLAQAMNKSFGLAPPIL
ncbi:class I SAM-dependent methyltransferase, partial [uncultured Oscillibacter sp.]|uniref:class I SAM-dependent DNA methyltransferase n=1 Tax=uncultured Oscillibacter sp. TaxID=876091 RepID=UPI00262D3D3E